jgi:hypothetical protein
VATALAAAMFRAVHSPGHRDPHGQADAMHGPPGEPAAASEDHRKSAGLVRREVVQADGPFAQGEGRDSEPIVAQHLHAGRPGVDARPGQRRFSDEATYRVTRRF